mgnify:CR=1 FL=1
MATLFSSMARSGMKHKYSCRCTTAATTKMFYILLLSDFFFHSCKISIKTCMTCLLRWLDAVSSKVSKSVLSFMGSPAYIYIVCKLDMGYRPLIAYRVSNWPNESKAAHKENDFWVNQCCGWGILSFISKPKTFVYTVLCITFPFPLSTLNFYGVFLLFNQCIEVFMTTKDLHFSKVST